MKKESALIALLGLCAACGVNLEGWDGEANFVNFTQSEALQGETHLKARLELKVGKMEIEPLTGPNLYELDLRYDELGFKPKVRFERHESGASLEVGLEGAGKSFRRLGENILNLRLNREVDIDLENSTGVGETSMDLTGLKVRSLLLEAGVGETAVSILSKNETDCRKVDLSNGVGALKVTGLGNLGFEEFDFRGGVGESRLDFTGSWHRIGDIEIEVGVGEVQILLPRDMGAEIRVSKSFLSGVNFPGFEKRGDVYYSENSETAQKLLRMNVRAGIGGVEVRWL